MIARSSFSENGFLPYSRSSKSTFFDCKKLLALRQVVHVALYINLIRSAMLCPLLEKLRDSFERFGMDFVAFGPAACERNGRVDNRYGVAQPAAKTLHLADDVNVLVPVHSRR